MDALGKHLWQEMLRAVMHSLDAWPWVVSRGWVMVGGCGVWGEQQASGRGMG